MKLLQGDCLELMKDIPDKSIDMILCDLPYGITNCKWDTVIPFEPLWEQYKRIIKDNGAIVLFGSQPFTSALVMSNPKWFKYEWIWIKSRPTGFLNAKKMPMKEHENICVFYKKLPIYNPQMQERSSRGQKLIGSNHRHSTSSSENYRPGIKERISITPELRHPSSTQKFDKGERGVHPTQKPVALCEYLIKTYTNEGDLVLDNCMGSGTTGVACANLNRDFIGMELDEKYFQIAYDRITKGVK